LGIIGKKDRHVREGDDPQLGNVWTWCAIDSETKLVPAFRVGQRDAATAIALCATFRRMANRVQISTDGLQCLRGRDRDGIWRRCRLWTDHQDLRSRDFYPAATRYSQPEITAIEKKAISGRPTSTSSRPSYIERLNATTRLHHEAAGAAHACL